MEGKRPRETYLSLNELIYQIAADGEADAAVDILSNIVLSKLPPSLHTRIMIQSDRSNHTYVVFDILSCVSEEVERERMEDAIRKGYSRQKSNQTVSNTSAPQKKSTGESGGYVSGEPTSSSNAKSKRRGASMKQRKDPACRLCHLPGHYADEGTKYTTARDRKTVAIQQKLGLNCLGEGHQASVCRSGKTCFTCIYCSVRRRTGSY